MTMQTDLFHGPRYWRAAYGRRWAKMLSSSASVFVLTAALIIWTPVMVSGAKGYLVAIYWLLSLQVCYDDSLNYRVYLGWAATGLLVSVLAWSSLSSESIYGFIQLGIIGVSLFWAYLAHQRKLWREWWMRFTFWEFDPDGNRSLTTEELCVKFGLGRTVKPKPYQVLAFLRNMKALGYVRPQRPIAYQQTSTWLELNIANSHLVDHFLLKGVIPPHANWLRDYINKCDPQHKLLVREPA